MFWMGETHTVDGRTVRIKGLGALDRAAAQETREMLLEFCKHRRIAARFPRLLFEIVSSRNVDDMHTTAWVNSMAATKGEFAIYLSAEALMRGRAELPQRLEHEATHLWQATEKAEERYLEKLTKLKSGVDCIDRVPSERLAKQVMEETRHTLALTFNRFFSEGLARFAEYDRAGEVQFSVPQLERLHEDAARDAQALASEWQHFLVVTPLQIKRRESSALRQNKVVIERNFAQLSYEIGYSMAYMILMEGEATFEEMVAWSDHKFVKRYEHACHTFGLRPIVTLTINAPFCYNTMIRQCLELEHPR